MLRALRDERADEQREALLRPSFIRLKRSQLVLSKTIVDLWQRRCIATGQLVEVSTDGTERIFQ
jgi:hypothetical protein